MGGAVKPTAQLHHVTAIGRPPPHHQIKEEGVTPSYDPKGRKEEAPRAAKERLASVIDALHECSPTAASPRLQRQQE